MDVTIDTLVADEDYEISYKNTRYEIAPGVWVKLRIPTIDLKRETEPMLNELRQSATDVHERSEANIKARIEAEEEENLEERQHKLEQIDREAKELEEQADEIQKSGYELVKKIARLEKGDEWPALGTCVSDMVGVIWQDFFWSREKMSARRSRSSPASGRSATTAAATERPDGAIPGDSETGDGPKSSPRQ